MDRSYRGTQRRKYLRRKFRKKGELSEAEWGEFHEWQRRRMERGIVKEARHFDAARLDLRTKRAATAVAELRERWKPILERYREQIALSPELGNRETMAAMYLDTIDVATTVTQVEKALKQLQSIYGHAESKVVETLRTEADVERELDETIGRLSDGE